MKKRNKKASIRPTEYDVEIKATLNVRVSAINAFHAIATAEAELQEQLSGSDIDLINFRTISSSSVED